MLSQTETAQIVSPIQRLLSPLIRWTSSSSNKSLAEVSPSQQILQSSQESHELNASDTEQIEATAAEPLLIVDSLGKATIQAPDGLKTTASDVQSSDSIERKGKEAVISQQTPHAPSPYSRQTPASQENHIPTPPDHAVKRTLPRRAFNRDILESDLIFGASSNNSVVHDKERLLPTQKVVISDLSHYRGDKYEPFEAMTFEDPNENQHFKAELKIPTFTQLPAVITKPHLLHRPDPLPDETYLLAHQTMEQYGTRVRNLERNKVSSERLKLEKDLEVLEGFDWRQAVIPTAAKRGNYVEQEILHMRNRRIDELRSLLDRMTKYYKDNEMLKERMDRELSQWNQKTTNKIAKQKQEQRKRKFTSSKSDAARNSNHSRPISSFGFIEGISKHKAKSKEFSLTKIQSVSR